MTAHEADATTGRCSCKTNHVAAIVAEVNVTELLAQRITEGRVGGVSISPVCPECRDGKHRNCDGVALDEAADELTTCTCPPAFHPERQS